MKNKNYIKCISFFLISLIIYTVISSVFMYFDIISGKIADIINFIFITTLMFITGFKLSMFFESKGYKAGLIMGLVNMIILFTISLILRSNISFHNIVYYLILLLSSTIGGMAGINFKINSK